MNCLILSCHPHSNSFTAFLSQQVVALLRDKFWWRDNGDEHSDGKQQSMPMHSSERASDTASVHRDNKHRAYTKHANTAAPGQLTHIDLYQDAFNPILEVIEIAQRWSFDVRVQEHVRILQQSDLIVIVHPVWWGGMPALLSGWIQRVWKSEVAYRYGGDDFMPKHAEGLFSEKCIFVVYICDGKKGETSGADALRAHWQHIFSFSAAMGILYPIEGMRSMNIAQRKVVAAALLDSVLVQADRISAQQTI